MKIVKSMIKELFYALNLRTVVLSLSLLLCIFNTKAQDTIVNDNKNLVTIHGIVRDAGTHQPVATAHIQSLNYEAAASVNDDGTFQIKVASLNEILSVSAIDYSTREISVKGQDSVMIELYPAFFSSPYKMVETPAGLVNNTFTTGGINSFDDISASPNISIDNEIQKQLGGSVRSVTRSGTAGIGTTMFIQGINSLNANAQPLYVVDGVIWENNYGEISVHEGYFTNPLLTIDVADIESVTVLKDGTSLYGSKGANGVILIKTKRTKDMVTKINVNSFWGITSGPKLIPVMSAEQYRLYASEMVTTTTGFNKLFLNNDPSLLSYLRYHNTTDWSDEVYRKGFTHSYYISVTGGDERALYMFSVGYTGNKGIVKNTDLERLNARFNADIKFTKKFTVGWDISYTDVNRNLLNDGADLVSPTFLAYIKAPFLHPYKYSGLGELTSDFEDADDFRVGNPTAIIQNSINTNKQNRFNIGIKPSYRINSHLTFQNQFGYSLCNTRENFFTHDIGRDSILFPQYNIVAVNEARGQVSKNSGIYNDARLLYSTTLGVSHAISGILGWRFINNEYQLRSGLGYNTTNNSPGLDNAKYKKVSGALNKYKTFSTYVNIDYSYNKKYLLSVVFDMDASSRFGNQTEGSLNFLGAKWGVFPSVNGAWIISSERFMKSLDFINLIKVRVGYGLTGNDDIGYYGSRASLASKGYSEIMYGLVIDNIANDKIQWETTYRTNIGLDISILNEKVTLSGNYFTGTTKNLLMLTDYPIISGLGKYWSNAGEMGNKGYDISAGIKALNLDKLKWEVGLSIGHYKNKIKSLPNGRMINSVYGGEVLTEVGKPAAVFYGYKTNGVFTTSQEAENADLRIVDEFGKSHYYGAGDIHFVDQDNNHIINDLDKDVIGDPNPDFYGSFNTSVSYKNLILDVLFTYSYGNDIYNYLRSQLESGSQMYNQSITMVNRWRAEGQQTSQPRVSYGDSMHNAAFSDRWIEDGSYLKLKTLSLSYKVPLKTKHVEGLIVWISANNLFTLTKYLGSDPEFSARNGVLYQGVDAGLLPGTKSYFIGLKINF